MLDNMSEALSLVDDGYAYCATWVDRMEDRLVYLLESAA